MADIQAGLKGACTAAQLQYGSTWAWPARPRAGDRTAITHTDPATENASARNVPSRTKPIGKKVCMAVSRLGEVIIKANLISEN